MSRRDLYVFAKGVMGFDWLIPHIHMPLCRLLELYNGYDSTLSHPWKVYESVLRRCGVTSEEALKDIKSRGLKKLKITLPRGWLKTTLCSQAYPVWRAVRDSGVRVLLTQNTFTNAVAKNLTIKSTVEKNPLFRVLFPEVLPGKQSTWKGESLCFSRNKAYAESTFEAAGTGTQVTSRHYDVIIEDDTVAPELNELGEEALAPTKADIDQAIGWHRLVSPLLVNPSTSQNLVVGTRWFVRDLLSWIDEKEPSFVSYTRSCLENADGVSDESGEPAYPERFDRRVLDDLRSSLGPYLFSTLYLNKPLRSSDMVFQPEWFTYYETEPLNLAVYTTVDPANDPDDTQSEPDYNVVETCGKDINTGYIYVLEYTREKCSPSRLISILFRHVRKYDPIKVGVEEFAYQKTLKYWIKDRMRNEGYYFNIEGIKGANRSKSARIMGLQPLVSSGTLLFRKTQVELINELLAFPLGKNDDIIDALAHQLGFWKATKSKKELKEKELSGDPLSFNSAVDEILTRGKKNQPMVFDVFTRREGTQRDVLCWG